MFELLSEAARYGNMDRKQRLTAMKKDFLALLKKVKDAEVPSDKMTREADELHGHLTTDDFSSGSSSVFDLIMDQSDDSDAEKKSAFLQRLKYDLIDIDRHLKELKGD